MRVFDIVPVSFAAGAAGLLPSGRGGEPIGARRPKVNIALTTLQGQGRDRTGSRHGKGRTLK